MKEKCDFPAFVATELDANILHINMKKVKKLTSSDVSQIYDCYRKFKNQDGVLVLVTFDGYFPMSSDAMNEASRLQNQKIVRGMAYVIRSTALRVGAKFFMTFYKPTYPTDIFATKTKAVAWLKKQKRK